MFRNHRKNWLRCAALALVVSSVAADPGPVTLRQAFEAAWLRQPEALSQQARRDVAVAEQQGASRWTAEPPVLEWSTKTDRLNRKSGRDEAGMGLSIVLWLPGERDRTLAVADAQARATGSRLRAAQLRTAASVREAYWAWQRSLADHGLATDLLIHARQLAQDVARRVSAGDLARADQHQADGAMASAEATLAQATGALMSAAQHLGALTGLLPPLTATDLINYDRVMEPAPGAAGDDVALDVRHPSLAELQDGVTVAQRSAELAHVQTRANPELTLMTNRDRGQRDEDYQHSLTLGLRFPLGSDSRNQAKRADAQAQAIEAEARLLLERDRLRSEVQAARANLASAQLQSNALRRRAKLARESRAFFQKSFQLGETDLPTRLRMEREAMDAERQAARAGIDRAAAVSALRQALGLLPE